MFIYDNHFVSPRHEKSQKPEYFTCVWLQKSVERLVELQTVTNKKKWMLFL